MPVSTRSQIINQANNGATTEQKPRPKIPQEDILANMSTRNPHQGLKEKLKALTLLYEQQKQSKNLHARTEEPRFTSHPSVQLFDPTKKEELKDKKIERNQSVMKENVSCVGTRAYVLPQPPLHEAKENNMACVNEKIIGFPSRKSMPPTMSVARKLSMGGNGRNLQEVEKMESCVKAGESSRILVFVRLRPMNKKEKEAGARGCVRIVNKRDVYLTEFANENDYLRLKRLRGRHFTFDASFPDSATQQDVYSTSTADLVEAVLQGKNGSVFCYGATGAGKTYTMLGTVENPGVMVLAIKDLFTKIRQRSYDGNHVVHLSYLEVYNETVRDLLSPGRPLVLREDKQGIMAAGLTQYRAYSTDEVMALLQQGNQNRTTEPTRANETSSRSHAILQVVAEFRVRDSSLNIVNRVGKLSLIDLAGSERALATDQRTLRSLEGANINRSLLALSSCINALVEGKKHIPYRNSKLTQLLKDSLGGACNTVMIANISPSNLSFGETQNTLHWADRAKEIRTKGSEVSEEVLQVPESETDQAKLLLEVQKENRELRMQLARQQQKLISLQAQSLAANSSPTPSSVTCNLTPPNSAQPNEKKKPRSSFLTNTCFTPESKRKGADETFRELKQTVKSLQTEIERIKKDHAFQLKQKDDQIRELSRKGEKPVERTGGEVVKRVVTRARLRSKEACTGELKSPSSRFKSPVPTAKKRSFWDITTNSPSVATRNERKIKTSLASEMNPGPSMLRQPGFARQRP